MTPLSHIISPTGVELEQFFIIATEIAIAIEELHSQNVIHNDINPNNIIISTKHNTIKLIDFDSASLISEELIGFKPISTLQGTLSHASPEQTGRINKPVDLRSDLYSIGVTFYQLLTGTLPFDSTQPGKLIYSHIAKIPDPVSTVRQDIPQTLSRVIDKLLKKTPDERYQSATGLKKDLLYLQKQLSRNIEPSDFVPGKNEQTEKIILTGKLYGRQKETNCLLDCFDKCSTSGQLVTVTGLAGIGKTALIRELYTPITKKKGFFLSGKFDQFSKGLAYTAIVEALKGFVRQCMGQDETSQASWQTTIQSSVGEFGEVLTDIVPEFEKLIGRQPNISPVPPQETVNRRNAVFTKLINDICQTGCPLVIFLDDLQWGDSSTLSLLEKIIETNPRNLMVILSYRDNELLSHHPARQLLDRLNNQNIAFSKIHLEELNKAAIIDWLNDTMPNANLHMEDLANCLLAKTEGNPFYITSLLHFITENNYIKREADGTITFNMEAITAIPADTDIVEHLIRKINRLDQVSHKFLTRLSVLGNKFSQTLINLALDIQQREYQTSIRILVAAHLLIKSGDILMFAHDRIQQAAHALLSATEASELHLKVGQNIKMNLECINLAHERIEEYIHHYNIAADLITDEQQRLELAKLNMAQGKRLKNNAAYQEAEHSFSKAAALLPQRPFDTTYNTSIELFTEYGETLFLNLKYQEGNKQFDAVITHSKLPLDRATVFVKQINHYAANHNPKKSLKIALHALESLDIKLPKTMLKAAGLVGLLQTERLLKNQPPEGILDYPVTEDPKILAQMDILSAAVAPAFITDPDYLPLIIFQMMKLSITKGNSRVSPYGYVVYALILCSIGKAETGYAYGKAALALMEKLNTKQLFTKVPYVFATFVHHWKAAASDSVKYLETAMNKGLETGDYEFASFAVSTLANVHFYSGENISKLIKDYDKYHQILAGFGKDFAIYEAKYWHQMLITMNDPTGDGTTVSGEVIDETNLIKTLEEQQVLTTLARCMISKMQLAYLAGNYTLAMSVRKRSIELLKAMTADMLNTICHFFSALTCIAYYRTQHQSSSLLREAKHSLKKLKKWGADAPSNYLCKAQLVEAELLAVKGKQLKALKLFEKAIHSAQNTSNSLDYGIACECMGRYLLSIGLESYGMRQLERSANIFHRWGAFNKSQRLSNEFKLSIITNDTTATSSSSSHSSQEINATLDLEALTRSIKSLTGNLEFDTLLESLLDAVMQNSGATRVVYIHINQNNLEVKAEKHANTATQIFNGKNTSPASFNLPTNLLESCYSESREYILDNINASSSPEEANNPESRLKSVLIIPLLKNNIINGMVYLENDLLADAFREDQVQFISLLAGQAAIAVENARIFCALQLSEEKFRSLIESSCDMIWEVNLEGVYTYISPQVESILGYSQQEIIGKTAFDFMPQDEAKRVAAIFKSLIKNKQSIITVENVNLHKDNRLIILETSGVPVLDESGKVTAYRGIGRDISKRKQAEEELKKARNYITNIIDSMPSVLVGVDTDGKVTQWNKTAEQMTSLSSNSVKGKILSEVFPQMASQMPKIRESIRTCKVKKELNIPHQQDGKMTYEDITIYPLTANGVGGAVIRIDDVSKEHELAEQLNQSRKMDAIGQLAGGVAHDFNNMLGGIMGAAKLLTTRLDSEDKKSLHFVDMIMNASIRASDLTAKLLTFGRKGKLESTAIDIHNIITETHAILFRTIDKKISIKLETTADNSIVIGDASQLQSALMNLGINASHAMPSGGELYISTKNIILNNSFCHESTFEIEPGEFIDIEVRDTGCGIEQNNLKNIFEPFFTTKKQGKGTGLGLAAVYGTVKDHHGAITVTSTVGIGTSFHILLHCQENNTHTQQEDEEVLKGTGVILLVDDEEIIRQTGKGMLEKMGYQVLLAENGNEAVNIFQKHHSDIDLVLLDMIMPVMDGYETFVKIKEIDETSNIIISSGFIKKEKLTELKSKGLAGFIRKPYIDFELSKLIADILTK